MLLSLPTNRTVTGPKLEQERDCLVVRYDYQADDGSLEWVKVIFREVLALEYRQMACCTESSVGSAREIRSVAQSLLLSDVLKRWGEAVGWQEWQQKQGGESRFRHFTIFFDDVGCVDVIAAVCEIC